MGKVDLHIHTTASDGVLTPEEVVETAIDKGLFAIAITDHDTVEGINAALTAAQDSDLEVIPGVELSAEQDSSEVHILGYYFDHGSSALQEKLVVLRQARKERAWNMVRKLERMGLAVSWERVQAIAGDSSAFGRPHIARALLERGYVASVNDAFQRYIGLGGPAYVSRYKLSPKQAVEMIRAAGGLPVLAHPWRQREMVAGLAGLGLVGLEAYCTGYSPEASGELVRLGEKHNLIATGGTDFHGYGENGVRPLGDVPVPMESLERLRALADRGTVGDKSP
jgi:predicted metal-dependent phosphoesterase TrpH